VVGVLREVLALLAFANVLALPSRPWYHRGGELQQRGPFQGPFPNSVSPVYWRWRVARISLTFLWLPGTIAVAPGRGRWSHSPAALCISSVMLHTKYAGQRITARVAVTSMPSRACGLVHIITARAGNRRFGLSTALRAHTKPPQREDPLWETPRALKRPRAGPDSGMMA
jgi:hypothetical protein